MDLLKLIQVLFKLKKFEKRKKNLEKLLDFARKAERVKDGKVKPTELQAMSNKTVSGCSKEIQLTAKKAADALKATPKFPLTKSAQLYHAMAQAAKKHGQSSAQFVKAEKAYKDELRAYDAKLKTIYTQLSNETAKANKNVYDLKAMAEYCSKISLVFQNLVKLPNFAGQQTAFFSLSRGIAALATQLGHLADQYNAIEKKNQEYLAALLQVRMFNNAWIKKKFESVDDIKRNEKARKPR